MSAPRRTSSSVSFSWVCFSQTKCSSKKIITDFCRTVASVVTRCKPKYSIDLCHVRRPTQVRTKCITLCKSSFYRSKVTNVGTFFFVTVPRLRHGSSVFSPRIPCGICYDGTNCVASTSFRMRLLQFNHQSDAIEGKEL